MHALRSTAFVGLVGALAVTCGVTAGASLSRAAPEAGAPPSPSGWSLRAAARLSVPEQVGQLIVGGFDGGRLPPSVKGALRAGRLSGVILFGDNVTSPSELRRLTQSVKRASVGNALISVDQEGGLVRRIPFAAPRQAQPAHGAIRRVRQIAAKAARNLQALGVNVNFAPVADVPAGRRTALADRAFLGSPALIGRKTAGAVTEYREERVAATVKHFPGLGAAPLNTDDAPVVIRRKRPGLDRIDLVPFRAAIRARTPLVMAAHASYPALDGRRIASQSRRVLHGLLRKQLKFKGAVITDALEANAVLRRSSVAVAAERSLRAGADLLLLTEPENRRPVFRWLLARARQSLPIRDRLEEATARVLDLKRFLGLRLPGAATRAG